MLTFWMAPLGEGRRPRRRGRRQSLMRRRGNSKKTNTLRLGCSLLQRTRSLRYKRMVRTEILRVRNLDLFSDLKS